MSSSTIDNLKKTTSSITKEQTAEEKISSLTQAFQLFSQETTRLESAYNKLKKQFQEVNLELKNTNQELHKKVSELDMVTNYLNNILGNITQGILFIGFNGAITTYNQSAEKILNFPKEKLLFESFWEHFDD